MNLNLPSGSTLTPSGFTGATYPIIYYPDLGKMGLGDSITIDDSNYAKLNSGNTFTEAQQITKIKPGSPGFPPFIPATPGYSQMMELDGATIRQSSSRDDEGFVLRNDGIAFTTFDKALHRFSGTTSITSSFETLNDDGSAVMSLNIRADNVYVPEPTKDRSAATKRYVDAAISGVTIDDSNYAKLDSFNQFTNIQAFTTENGTTFIAGGSQRLRDATQDYQTDFLNQQSTHGILFRNPAGGAQVLLNQAGDTLQLSAEHVQVTRDPEQSLDVATKRYVDAKVSGTTTTIDQSNLVHLTGDESIGGAKTFTNKLKITNGDPAALSLEVALVKPDSTGGGNQIVFNNASGTSWKNQFALQVNGVEKWSLGNDANSVKGQDFFLYDGAADAVRLLVNDKGNLGVGTMTPAEKLDVTGNVKAVKFLGDGSSLTNLPAPVLYTGTGQNVNGAMTQKATTDALLALGGRYRGPWSGSTAYKQYDIIRVNQDRLYYATKALTTPPTLNINRLTPDFARFAVTDTDMIADVYPYQMPRTDKETSYTIPAGSVASDPNSVAGLNMTDPFAPSYAFYGGGAVSLRANFAEAKHPADLERSLLSVRVPAGQPPVSVFLNASSTGTNGTSVIDGRIDGQPYLTLNPGDWAVLATNYAAMSGASVTNPLCYYDVIMRGGPRADTPAASGTWNPFTGSTSNRQTVETGKVYYRNNSAYRRLGPTTGVTTISTTDKTNWGAVITPDVLVNYGRTNFPATGELNKLYVDSDRYNQYFWDGGDYYQLSEQILYGDTQGENRDGSLTQAAARELRGVRPIFDFNASNNNGNSFSIKAITGFYPYGSLYTASKSGDNYCVLEPDSLNSTTNQPDIPIGAWVVVRQKDPNGRLLLRTTGPTLMQVGCTHVMYPGESLMLHHTGVNEWTVTPYAVTKGFTTQAVRSAVTASANIWTSGELQGTQPAGSTPGSKFCDATYRYEYMNGMNDPDGTTFAWVRWLKA